MIYLKLIPLAVMVGCHGSPVYALVLTGAM
jgi:hypothetical protein